MANTTLLIGYLQNQLTAHLADLAMMTVLVPQTQVHMQAAPMEGHLKVRALEVVRVQMIAGELARTLETLQYPGTLGATQVMPTQPTYCYKTLTTLPTILNEITERQ